MVRWIAGAIVAVGFSVACVGIYQLAANKSTPTSETNVIVGVIIMALVCIFYPKDREKE